MIDVDGVRIVLRHESERAIVRGIGHFRGTDGTLFRGEILDALGEQTASQVCRGRVGVALHVHENVRLVERDVGAPRVRRAFGHDRVLACHVLFRRVRRRVVFAAVVVRLRRVRVGGVALGDRVRRRVVLDGCGGKGRVRHVGVRAHASLGRCVIDDVLTKAATIPGHVQTMTILGVAQGVVVKVFETLLRGRGGELGAEPMTVFLIALVGVGQEERGVVLGGGCALD